MDRPQHSLGRQSVHQASSPTWRRNGGRGSAATREQSLGAAGNAYLRSNSSARRLQCGSLDHVAPSRPAGQPLGSAAEQAALLARVQSVSVKADALLASVGKGSNSGAWMRGVRGRVGAERFADLTERLAQLEILLDELAAHGLLHPVRSGLHSDVEAVADSASLQDVAQSLLEVMRQRQGVPRTSLPQARMSSTDGVPFMVVRQQSAGSSSVRSGTPLPSARLQTPGRFVEVPPAAVGLTAGAPVGPPAATSLSMGLGGLPPPPGLQWPPCLQAPGLPSPPAVPPAPGPSSPAVPQPFVAPSDCWRNSPPPHSSSWHLGGRAPGPGGGAATPRVGGGIGQVPLGLPVPVGGNSEGRLSPPTPTPARAFSAPRGASMPPTPFLSAAAPHGSALAAPRSSPSAVGHGPTGIQAAAVPVTLLPPPPAGLWMPSLGQLLQDSAEGKIREWLKTIPIGNGADRGWDDGQILQIAEFAQDQHLEHLAAEDIYKRYVEHQVESAEAADS